MKSNVKQIQLGPIKKERYGSARNILKGDQIVFAW